MWTGRYDRKSRVIVVEVWISGPLGVARLNCVLDTGTQRTVIDPAIADQLGYSARMGRGRSRLTGVAGVQEGYRLEVQRMETMGFSAGPFAVLCHDFEEGLGIDGLIGMDALDDRIVTIDAIHGLLSVGS